MTVRFNNKPKSKFGVPPLPTGYGGRPSNETIAPVGIEDVDLSLFNLFNDEIAFTVHTGSESTQQLVKVPVIFAAGEKWAVAKRQKAVRDRNGSLILPLITIVRSGEKQDLGTDVTGRGINQQTGEIVIKRKLDHSDRAYQDVVNRLYLKHQSSLAVAQLQADPGQLSTLRSIGDLAADPTVATGGLLLPDRMNNVYEFLTLPAPQFYTATYEVVFWTQYTSQMNEMLEKLLSSFLPQGNCWRLDTPKGYWFIAKVDGNNYTSETNQDDYSAEERIIKHKFSVTVPAYVLASDAPGNPIPVRKYVSCPSVSFEIFPDELSAPADVVPYPFVGADDPTLPLDPVMNKRRDQLKTEQTRLYPSGGQSRPGPRDYRKITTLDRTGKTSTTYVKVTSTNNKQGETVLSSAELQLGGIESVVVE
jgi:hypothetical protein